MKCQKCGNDVIPKKKFSIIWCVLTSFLPYLIYYAIKSTRHCPVCGNKMK